MVHAVPPSPIPAPLPPWARTLLQLVPLITAGLQEALQYIGTMNDNTGTANSEWRRVLLTGKPVGSVDAADNWVTTMDLVNITNGTIDNSWTSGDYSTTDAILQSLCSGWAAHMNSHHTFVDIRYYRMAFNPLTDPRPFQKTGPPDHIAVAPYVGQAGGTQAPQVAMTTTDRTAYPKHWGRNYWPHPVPTFATDGMHILQATVDAWATALGGFYGNLMTAQFFPVTVVTQVDKVPTRGLLTTSALQVDNVYDVVRRRRTHQTTYRKTINA